MTRNPRYDLLFEPVRIGPVVSKNRFYQVPHCNGTGDWSPMATAAMRETKAEGGWGVVCTENMMVDAWSDIAPFPAVRLWSDEDIAAQEEMVDRVHLHGALAGCELAHFAAEGHEEDHVSFVKTTTAKPVVGVGRFTSPDTMVSQIRRDGVDLIGAGDWHPERVERSERNEPVLIVGSGPAGLECALTLARRGYPVTLAEAAEELGGRVARESRLPGLSEWIRVRDYRATQLRKMNNVDIYLASTLSAKDVIEFGVAHVVCATGASWRRDGLGRQHLVPVVDATSPNCFTPDDAMEDAPIEGPVVISDDDGSYLVAALAEKLAANGLEVTIVAPHSIFARWRQLTLEQGRLTRSIIERGSGLEVARQLVEFEPGSVRCACVYLDREYRIAAASLVLATSGSPDEELHRELSTEVQTLKEAGIQSVYRIGDCDAPGLIVDAVFSGHRLARELDQPGQGDLDFKRELAWPRD